MPKLGGLSSGFGNSDVNFGTGNTFDEFSSQSSVINSFETFMGDEEQLAENRENMRNELDKYIGPWRTNTTKIWEDYSTDEKERIAQESGVSVGRMTDYLSGREMPRAEEVQKMQAAGIDTSGYTKLFQAQAETALQEMGVLDPYQASGGAGLAAMQQGIQGYQSILNNPQAVLQDPAVQAQIQASVNAVDAGNAARGMQLSGRNLKEISTQAGLTAQQNIDQSLQRYANMASIGAQQAGMGQDAASQMASLGVETRRGLSSEALAAMTAGDMQNAQFTQQAGMANMDMQTQLSMANLGAQTQYQQQQISGLKDAGALQAMYSQQAGDVSGSAAQSLSDIETGLAQAMTGANLGMQSAQAQESAENKSAAAGIVSTWLGSSGSSSTSQGGSGNSGGGGAM